MSIPEIDPKYLSLIVLMVQNTLLVLLMRISRTTQSGPMYAAPVAVMMDELLKLAFCSFMLFYAYKRESGKWYELVEEEGLHPQPRETMISFLNQHIFQKHFFYMAVPALLYAFQKNLLFIAVSNLDAATFQVAYQGKILTTAFFVVLLLGNKLNSRQVVSLIFLLAGVALVQVSSLTESASKDNHTVGYLAVLGACFTSGFASIYFEWVLKFAGSAGEKPWFDLWTKNFQLAVFASASAALGVYLSDELKGRSLFSGFTWLVWLVVLLQAFGGIMVALVIKYADNILKNFATSVSIVLSVIVSAFFLSFKITLLFSLGAMAVMVAVALYTSDPNVPLLEALGIRRRPPTPAIEEFDLKELSPSHST